ncbi:outer membrane beta-barrel protein [Photobacterium galatheae]|uniref:Uncharacterized protein n=1 Tax=Photobacterium galatheae TaxID=1654360 RepID=A0A066RPP6_9GAMM|nr:outer membrane beta-barrel protein [Photobacterium galatheae]KDM91081.1 hypothetical protein EA58_13060 [Photobacterium galatheae]MCM0150199.1 outer membrane beta-barrel protein [Photobacterium galatheae]
MNRLQHSVFLLIGLILSAPAFSKGERFGVTAAYYDFTSSAEEGESGENQSLRWGLVHTRPIDDNSARWRWWFGLNYLDDNIPAPQNGIYQEVTNYEFRVLPQYAFPVASWLTPYVGAGLSLAYSEYSERWYVDSDEFKYGGQLPDNNAFEAGLLLNAGTVLKIGSNPDAHLQVVPQATLIIPVNQGLGGVEFSLSFLF